MEAIAAFYRAGHAIDVVLVVIVLEALVLGALFRARNMVGLSRILLALVPGVFLLLAVRAAVTGEHWTMVALWISASFPPHLLDLWWRISQPR